MTEPNSIIYPSKPVDGEKPFKRMVTVFKQKLRSTSSATVVENGISRAEYKVALDGFAESARVGVEILSSIAEIHPFIKMPVMAFKLVLDLDIKRRENHAKVQSLKVEMVDMMSGFIQLNNLSGKHDFEADPHLKMLMVEIAKEITAAFNLADHYMKKNLIAQCLKSAVYEIRFAEYVQRFHNLGARLHRSLSIHIIGTTSHMEEKLDDIQDGMTKIFLALETLRERDIRGFIAKSGGAQACVESDTALDGLISKAGDGMLDTYGKDRAMKTRELKTQLPHELRENIDEALKANLDLFEKKLYVLNIQLSEINAKITTESDRVITALSGGHERIIDQHMRNIWREMGWKTSVKARNFVLAVRDYYRHGLHLNYRGKGDETAVQPSLDPAQGPSHPTSPSSTPFNAESNVSEPLPEISHNDDSWASEYINMSYLQPIAEAIDDDGSGFISVNEVNDFTNSCPKNWSMLQWLAYWAAGWHSSVHQYSEKIYRILRKLHRLRDIIRQENLSIVDYYLFWSFDRVKTLLQSTSKAVPQVRPELAALRDEFCQEEESKLEANLENISYNLDSRATVTLVTGPQRIERYIFPLIYLLLKRHLEIFHLARFHTLHLKEFVDRTRSLWSIFEAFDLRLGELTAVFKQMRVDPDSHLKHYAFGMFATLEELPDSTLVDVWNALPYDPHDTDDVVYRPDDIPLSILQYKPQDGFELPPPQITNVMNADSQHQGSIGGNWAGILVDRPLNRPSAPFRGVTRICLNDPANDSGIISGIGASFLGPLSMKCFILPTQANRVELDLVIEYHCQYRYEDMWIRCLGVFDAVSSTITGQWHSEIRTIIREPLLGSLGRKPLEYDPSKGDRFRGTFHFSRTPASLIRFRYSPEAFAQNAPKARWDFARASILYMLRRDQMNKDHTLSVFRDIRVFVESRLKLRIHANTLRKTDALSEDQLQTLYHSSVNICPTIDFFFFSIAHHLLKRQVLLFGCTCDGPQCADSRVDIIHPSYTCISCIDLKNPSNSLDFCVDCRQTSSNKRYPSHLTSHSLIRSYRYMHIHDGIRFCKKAREISGRLKSVLRASESLSVESTSSENGVVTAIIMCAICCNPVSFPCWVCIECDTERIVCDDCDEKHQRMPPPYKMVKWTIPLMKEKHALHAMVWIRDGEEVYTPKGDQLARVEDRLDRVEGLIKERLVTEQRAADGATTHLTSAEPQRVLIDSGSIEDRLSALENRFDSLETLLRDFISKA